MLFIFTHFVDAAWFKFWEWSEGIKWANRNSSVLLKEEMVWWGRSKMIENYLFLHEEFAKDTASLAHFSASWWKCIICCLGCFVIKNSWSKAIAAWMRDAPRLLMLLCMFWFESSENILIPTPPNFWLCGLYYHRKCCWANALLGCRIMNIVPSRWFKENNCQPWSFILEWGQSDRRPTWQDGCEYIKNIAWSK